ncbi:MAG: hypothetical protein P8Y27_04895, partial [Chromatiaceae bacterium]
MRGWQPLEGAATAEGAGTTRGGSRKILAPSAKTHGKVRTAPGPPSGFPSVGLGADLPLLDNSAKIRAVELAEVGEFHA